MADRVGTLGRSTGDIMPKITAKAVLESSDHTCRRQGLTLRTNRHVNHQAVEILAHDDLAGQAARRPALRHELEDVALIAFGNTDPGEPLVCDNAMAGRARAPSPALCVDTCDAVVHGAIHHRRARRRRVPLPATVTVYEHDRRH